MASELRPVDRQRRNGRGRWERGVESAERDARAVRLRAQGWTLGAISDELGYGSQANVGVAIRRALDAIPAPDVVELRKTMNEKYSLVERKLWRLIRRQYPLMHQGVHVHDGQGQPLYDVGPVLAAYDKLLRLYQDQRRLNGVDAPIQVEGAVAAIVRYEVAGVDMEQLR